MSDAVQIATMFFAFLSATVTAVLAYQTLKLHKKQDATNVKVEKIEKQTDGMATTLGAAMLAQGLAQGGMEERNRADDKATAKAEAGPAVTESVKGIIAEYKAGELKDDVAELSKTATETKKVVEGIDKKT